MTVSDRFRPTGKSLTARKDSAPQPDASPELRGTLASIFGSAFGCRKSVVALIVQNWLVLIPVILLNAVLAIEHVSAKNNEKIFTVTVNSKLLAAHASTTQEDLAGETQLNETLRAHWVSANPDGNINGRISGIDESESALVPIEQLDVTLLKRGEKVSTAATDAEGRFVLPNVQPGVYTLVAAGVNGFLAYGVHVLPPLDNLDDGEAVPFEDQPDNLLELKTSSDSDSDSMPTPTPAKFSTTKHEYYVAHYNVPPDAVIQEELQIDAAAVPPEFETLERISQNYLPAASALAIARDTDDLKAIQQAIEIRGGFEFPLADDGSFNGRIQPIATETGELTKLSEMNLFLIQEDLEVARVAVEENGKFKVEDVDPGVYSLVAAGKDGFAAMSIELVAADQNGDENQERQTRKRLPSSAASGNIHYVSTAARPVTFEESVPELGIAIVIDPQDVQFIQQELSRIVQLRRQMAPQFAPNPMPGQPMMAGQNGFFPGSGFAPNVVGDGFAGPIAYSPASSAVGGGPGRFFGRGNLRRFLIPGLIAAAIAIPLSDNDPVNPPPQSNVGVPQSSNSNN